MYTCLCVDVLNLRTANNWRDYIILDTSEGEKLEKWGDITLVRPDPQIIWKTEKKVLTTSSGNDVPTPTITAPITKSDILNRLAIVTAPATSQSALKMITAKQSKRYKYSIV